MPYASTAALPEAIRRALPAHAQEIFKSVFDAAWEGYRERDAATREGIAHRVAWAAVKRRYRKQDGQWLPIDRREDPGTAAPRHR